MKGLRAVQGFKEIAIYRTDGSVAFNDYATVDFVNRNQDDNFFERTERPENMTIDNEYFQEVIITHTPVQVEHLPSREMEYYFPILNYAECRECHGGTG